MIDTSMRTWDALPVAGVRTVFYCGNPVKPDTERIISFPVEEDYKTIGQKNLLAFPRALEWEWDYMARVNASCFVHKRRLLEHVQGLPALGVVRGLVSAPTHTCGVARPFLWGGGQMILSRDVVEAMMARKSEWRHDVMEDVALGELAQDCGYTLDSGARVCSVNRHEDGWQVIAYNGKPGFNFKDFSDIDRLDDQFFFRCKNDADRKDDAKVMRLLAHHLSP